MIEFEDKTFGCGEDNECGLQLKLKFDEDTKTAYGSMWRIRSLKGREYNSRGHYCLNT